MWGHGIKVESSASISFLCFRSDPNKQIFSYLKEYKLGHLSVSLTQQHRFLIAVSQALGVLFAVLTLSVLTSLLFGRLSLIFGTQ